MRALATWLAVLPLFLALAQPAPAAAGAMDGVVRGLEIGYDVAVLRPLNAGALVLGCGFFVLSAPLVAPMEGLGTAWDVFVYAPYEYTVLRGLGEL